MTTKMNGKRILLIKQSSLGDIVHTLPVAHALKRCFPECQLGWIVERSFAPLLKRDQAIAQVHPVHIASTSEPGAKWAVYVTALQQMASTLNTLRRAFHAQPYDFVLDLHASWRSSLFARMNPGGVRFGFADAREGNTLFQDYLVRVDAATVHAVDKNLLFCKTLECEPQEDDFYLTTNDVDDLQAKEFLRVNGIESGQPFVYVNPAARWQSKFWIASRWSELGDSLENAGIRVVFGGSEGDLVHITPIAANMRNSATIAAGCLSLMASVALMKRAVAYVGVDTGPMHIAAMLGIPVVALFGPTHPERVGPYGAKGGVVQAEGLDCLCCRKRVCEHHQCMLGISVATVYERVIEVMSHNKVP